MRRGSARGRPRLASVPARHAEAREHSPGRGPRQPRPALPRPADVPRRGSRHGGRGDVLIGCRSPAPIRGELQPAHPSVGEARIPLGSTLARLARRLREARHRGRLARWRGRGHAGATRPAPRGSGYVPCLPTGGTAGPHGVGPTSLQDGGGWIRSRGGVGRENFPAPSRGRLRQPAVPAGMAGLRLPRHTSTGAPTASGRAGPWP
jgi:hypothetical protein